MKKNVFVFGLISGLIVTAFMVFASIKCYVSGTFKDSEVYGYTGMLVAFSFIFVGIKNYRDKYNNGVISFGKAFRIGLFIALIASTFYVLVWVVEYYVFFPDWLNKYCTHVINDAKASGVSQLELDKKTAQMNWYKQAYKNPLFVVLLTYMEILPIGVVISLISGLFLKRKQPPATKLATA
jgi:hypothetical protein